MTTETDRCRAKTNKVCLIFLFFSMFALAEGTFLVSRFVSQKIDFYDFMIECRNPGPECATSVDECRFGIFVFLSFQKYELSV